MDIDVKSAPFRVKAAGPKDGLEEGQFVGYASVFGNVDSYGDIVEPGAFTKTLAEWTVRGSTIPVLWGHDMSDPFANVGGVLTAEEDDHGLKVTGSLDLENPTAAQVYRLIKGRRIDSMSFAYSVRDNEVKDDGNHLLDLELFEVSIVHVPANPEAAIVTVKSAADMLVKAGRTLSAKNEAAIRAAVESLTSVLSSLDAQDGKAAPAATTNQEQASGTTEAKSGASDEEPVGAKSSAADEEPTPSPSAVNLASHEMQLLALNTEGEGGSR